MFKNTYKEKCVNILSLADISINGNNPWDIKIIEPQTFKAVIKGGSLAFGETYINGWWECDRLDQLFERICATNIYHKFNNNLLNLTKKISAFLFNYQNKHSAQLSIKAHYDLDNTLFKYMLGNSMSYSCGYWKNATNLQEAQNHKHALICNKLNLCPGMKLLDIGCGWGSMAIYAAKNFNVEVVGITISKEQYNLAKDLCKGLPIKIYLKDYREIYGNFDRIVSIGMFEHVGYKNYNNYFKIINNLLAEDGLFLLHTIGSNVSCIYTDPWINKYIFPHGVLPSIQQIGNACENLFVMEDWHNFGIDYVKTLQSWYDNFTENYVHIRTYYNESFKRLWNYYLLQCIGSFKARKNQLWQIVFSKHGVPNGYISIR